MRIRLMRLGVTRIKRVSLFLLFIFGSLLGNTHCSSYGKQDPWCGKNNQKESFSLSSEERKKAFAEFASRKKHGTSYGESHQKSYRKPAKSTSLFQDFKISKEKEEAVQK